MVHFADTLADWLAARLAEAPEQPLGQRLAEGLRAAILQGVVAAGQRLPATRALAARLGVARNTLVAVYAQLAAEGFVVAGQGSGTYACRVAPEHVPRSRAAPHKAPRTELPAPALSRRGRGYLAHPLHRFWSVRSVRTSRQAVRSPDAIGPYAVQIYTAAGRVVLAWS